MHSLNDWVWLIQPILVVVWCHWHKQSQRSCRGPHDTAEKHFWFGGSRWVQPSLHAMDFNWHIGCIRTVDSTSAVLMHHRVWDPAHIWESPIHVNCAMACLLTWSLSIFWQVIGCFVGSVSGYASKLRETVHRATGIDLLLLAIIWQHVTSWYMPGWWCFWWHSLLLHSETVHSPHSFWFLVLSYEVPWGILTICRFCCWCGRM